MDQQEENTKWFSVFKNSIERNSQLAISKKLTVSVIDNSNLIPLSEIVEMKQFNQLDEEKVNNAAFTCFLDNRTYFFDKLAKTEVVSLSIYFALTKEKFIFTATKVIVSNKKKLRSTLKNTSYCEYLKNTTLSFIKEGKQVEENYLEKADNYCESINNEVFGNEKLVKESWESLNSEEKLDFEVITPETMKIDIFHERQKEDLVKFEAQEELLANDNFTLVYFVPFEVDYMIFPLPQVVANSRKPNFESLYKPPKKTRRFYYILNFLNRRWLIKELNP
jgi:hypothetical protein